MNICHICHHFTHIYARIHTYTYVYVRFSCNSYSILLERKHRLWQNWSDMKDEQRYMIWHLQHYSEKVNGFPLNSFWMLLILQSNYILPNIVFSSVPLASLQGLLMVMTLFIDLGHKSFQGKWKLRFQVLFCLGCCLFLVFWVFFFTFLKMLFMLSVIANILTSIVIDLLLIFLFVHFRHTPLAHSSEAWLNFPCTKLLALLRLIFIQK